MNAVMAGLGVWLPERVKTNDEWPDGFRTGMGNAQARVFNDIPQSSDAAAVTARHLAAEAADPFLGAKRRHVAPAGLSTIDAESHAATMALEDAGLAAEDVDCVIGYSITPERITPSSAPAVARRLGIRGAFTLGIEIACAAVPAQLSVARGLIATGQATNVLCTQGHLLLRGMPALHPAVPGLGDAATAFVVTAGDGADILDVHIVTHEEHYESVTWVRVDEGGPGWWEPGGGMRLGSENIAGAKALMRDTVAYGAQTIRECAARAQVDLERVEVLASVQPRGFIPRAIAEFAGLPGDVAVTTYEDVAHLGASGVIANLHRARSEGRLREGALIALYAQGAGFTRAAALLRAGGALVS